METDNNEPTFEIWLEATKGITGEQPVRFVDTISGPDFNAAMLDYTRKTMAVKQNYWKFNEAGNYWTFAGVRVHTTQEEAVKAST